MKAAKSGGFWLMFAGLLLLGNVASAQSEGPPVIIDRSELGYRLRASSEWKEVPADQDNDRVIERGDPECTIRVSVVAAEGLKEISKEVLDAVYQEVIQGFRSVTHMASKVEAHGGKPSGWNEFTGESLDNPGILFHLRQIFTVHEDRVYIITINALDDDWEAAKATWQAVVSNMEFVPTE